jgi:hypothetical protein
LQVVEAGGAASFSICFQMQTILSELIVGYLSDGGLGLEFPIADPFLYAIFRGF